MDDFKKTLNDCLYEFNFNQIEAGPLNKPLTIDFYRRWLDDERYGTMTYLKIHYAAKNNPREIHPELRSVITITQPYFPLTEPLTERNPARVALYAQNKDYHFWLKEKLQASIAKLRITYPDEIFLPYVDSGPVLERNWAYENGLGWFGKNTCLIHPKHGSLFFIAEILTSLSLAKTQPCAPLPDFCGTCQKCIDICPTGALKSPRVMVADRCISYLTIEAKGPPAAELRLLMGDWFFGCDLCQTVCPWNEKFFRQKKIRADRTLAHDVATTTPLPLTAEEDRKLVGYFRWLLAASNKQIQKANSGTALARAGGRKLKSTALIVIANRRLQALRPDVEKLQIAALAELQTWTLQQLDQSINEEISNGHTE